MLSRRGDKEKILYKRLLFSLLAASLSAFAQAPAGNAENGKKTYLRVGCYECHGTVGQGAQANPLAPKLAPKPLPLVALTAYIRKPAGNMPPYVSKVLSDADVADIRAYLATIPEPPPVSSFPLLKP